MYFGFKLAGRCTCTQMVTWQKSILVVVWKIFVNGGSNQHF